MELTFREHTGLPRPDAEVMVDRKTWLRRTALAALAVGLVLATAGPAAADLSKKEIRCRSLTLRVARAVFGKVLSVRHKCGSVKAYGKVSSDVDCSADPVSLSGVGLGEARLEARMERAARSRGRLATKCAEVSASALGLENVCDTSTTDWSEIGACMHAKGKEAADTLFGLTYKDGAGVLVKVERECRQSPVAQARLALGKIIQERSKCFSKAAKKGLTRQCLATVAWPGRRETTGDTVIDGRLANPMISLRESILGKCGADKVNLDSLGVASIVGDPSGASFSTHDMFSAFADIVVEYATDIIAPVFPTESHCGDGVTDEDEECDDGNRISCDGCDRDCTLEQCGNGSVCGQDEECDDGGAGHCVLNGVHANKKIICFVDSDCRGGASCQTNTDDCVGTCRVASCGDGYTLLGQEQCDNAAANSNTAADACRSTLDTSLAMVDDPLQVTSSVVFRLQSDGKFGDIEAGDSVDITLPSLPSAINGVSSSNIVGQRAVLASPGPGSNYIYFAPGSGTTFSSLGGPYGGSGGTVEATLECRSASCGDTVTDTGEYCDDGNAVEDDGCSTVCLEEQCGDGVYQPWTGEQCDNGVANSDITADACRLGCTDAFCGDGVIDTNEQCDLGPDNSDSATSSCRTNCTLGSCGDGVVTTALGEECDDGDTDNTDGCLNSCRTAVCGDGFLWAGTETCDDGNTDDGDGCSSACASE